MIFLKKGYNNTKVGGMEDEWTFKKLKMLLKYVVLAKEQLIK